MMDPTSGEWQLRIALCITELEAGGAERNLVELAVGLDREKFLLRVFCLGTRPRNSSLVERLASAGIPVAFCNGQGGFDAWRVFRRLRAMFRDWRPQVVQTFLWHANVLGPLAARAAGVPHVVTGLRVAEPGRRWRRSIERFAGRKADFHVAVSEGVARFARERIGLVAGKIKVVSNALETKRFPPAPISLTSLGISPGRRALLFVGRLEQQKGIDELIDHLPEFFAILPQHDLVIVGEGPLRSAIQKQIVAQGLDGQVHLVGRRDDVAKIMGAADVLLVPSRWEGMSNVVLEAMASRLSIVAFAVEGMEELLGPLSAPHIVAQRDWRMFVERTVQLVADESLRKQTGNALREQVENHFPQGQMIAQYETIYLGLADR